MFGRLGIYPRGEPGGAAGEQPARCAASSSEALAGKPQQRDKTGVIANARREVSYQGRSPSKGNMQSVNMRGAQDASFLLDRNPCHVESLKGKSKNC